MSVSFNTIPSGIRVPLFYAEMDNSAAATPTSQTASLLIGQMGEGKAEAGKPSMSRLPQWQKNSSAAAR